MARNTSGLRPPWKKGDPSPNPSGRPKKRPITDEFFRLADQELPEKVRLRIQRKYGLTLPRGITWSQSAAIRRFLDTLEKDGTRAHKEIREAIEGKSPQRIEISGPERKEISLKVIFTTKSKEQSKE